MASGTRSTDCVAVSGERLVAAVAVERHGDMPAGQLAELERRQASRVGEWLAEVPCHARKEIGVGGPDLQLAVIRRIPPGDPTGVRRLIEHVSRKGSRERSHRSG
jgi:hypothetical protein